MCLHAFARRAGLSPLFGATSIRARRKEREICGLDVLGDFALSGLRVADRKSRRLPLHENPFNSKSKIRNPFVFGLVAQYFVVSAPGAGSIIGVELATMKNSCIFFIKSLAIP